MAQALDDRQRGITNIQKAQVLLDILGDIKNLDAKIDDKIKEREYKAHPDKVKQFKIEMNVMKEGAGEVKRALGVSFKTLSILQKAGVQADKVEQRKKDRMVSMLSNLVGGKTLQGEKKKVVVFPKE